MTISYDPQKLKATLEKAEHKLKDSSLVSPNTLYISSFIIHYVNKMMLTTMTPWAIYIRSSMTLLNFTIISLLLLKILIYDRDNSNFKALIFTAFAAIIFSIFLLSFSTVNPLAMCIYILLIIAADKVDFKKLCLAVFVTGMIIISFVTCMSQFGRITDLVVFAGANTALSGHRERLPEGVQDGILTAKEISVLDFREADIVVLSACETAQGEITGEGVFGLQRAFKMTGAQSLLMAIWPVDDKATQLLMTSFYRYYSQGMSKREAFRSAQQEVRNYTADGVSSEDRGISGKEKKLNKGKMGGGNQPSDVSQQKAEGSQQKAEVSMPYASPYYWAGFILLD